MDTATPTVSRQQRRRVETRAEILAAAWQLAADRGLAGVSLREIGVVVGMRAPSLYSYFPSKAAILDAMFADGYDNLTARLDECLQCLSANDSASTQLATLLQAWIHFCQDNPARYQLMFTHAMPAWRPSEEAYRASLSSYEQMRAFLALHNIKDQAHVDLLTALAAGLIAQQMANDPEGDRWLRRVDDVVEMYLHHVNGQAALKETT